MDFIPKSNEETKAMLKEVGVDSINALFSDIPETAKQQLKLPKGISEAELKSRITKISKKNRLCRASFLGAGSYSHYIPSIVKHIISRSEFYTAYTPYQAEISQGILQAIFEYQTMLCALTDMDVSNASLYDGAEALAEAAIICLNKTGREEILISRTVHPEYRQTVKTYLDARDKKLVEIDFDEKGKTDIEKLKDAVNENTAGILIQSPNFFGIIEDTDEIRSTADENSSLLAVSITDPTCLGILTPPKADIITAEGQSLGNPKSFGGPYLGMMAVKQHLMRYIPGRIVGRTVDKENNIGYTLTLQAREQHIRREKASSNICSNQALNALAATIYLAALGKKGMEHLASLNLRKSYYAIKELEKNDINTRFNSHSYNEFLVEFTELELKNLKRRLEEKDIEPGLDISRFYPGLKNCMLFCITEMCSKQDIDALIRTIHEVKQGENYF